MKLLLPLLAALSALGQSDLDWATLALKVDALSSDDPQERLFARHDLETLRPALLSDVKQGLEKPERRFVAACAAALMGDPGVRSVLFEAAGAGPVPQRIAAFEALRNLEPDSTLCMKALDDVEPRIALAAGRALLSRKDAEKQASKLDDIVIEITKTGANAPLRRQKRLVILRHLLAEHRKTKTNPVVDTLANPNVELASTALLGLYQADPATFGEASAAPLRKARLRRDFSNAGREMAGLLLVRSRGASAGELAEMCSDPSAEIRHAVRSVLTPAPPDAYALARWAEIAAADAMPADLEDLFGPWIERVSPLPPGLSAGDRLRLARAWLTDQVHAAVVPGFEGRVEAAIKRGSAWVASASTDPAQRRFGEGELALVAYTLLKCGMSPDADPVKAHLDHLEETSAKPEGTYDAALRAMAFAEAISAVKLNPGQTVTDDAKSKLRKGLENVAKYLMRGQLADGSWTYSTTVGTTDRPMAGTGDNSNAQFAVLGLRAAMNGGVKVPESVWKAIEKHWFETSEKGGGWGYAGRGQAKNTMTAAGLSAILIARSTLTGRPPSELLKGIPVPDAVEWLKQQYSVNAGHVYWMWSLERACMIAGISKLGDHDWYREGAEAIVEAQGEAGCWPQAQYGPLVDSCFSLLFLRRAYVAVATPGGQHKPGGDVETPGGENRRQK